MPGALDFIAPALAQTGSSVFQGLLRGREIANEEEDRRLRRERQTFLERLAAAREAQGQRRLDIAEENQQRLLQYLQRPSPLGSGHMVAPKSGGGWEITSLPKPAAEPSDPIKRVEAMLIEAHGRGDTAQVEVFKNLLQTLQGAIVKPPQTSHVVPPGATLVGPTGETLFTAPEKPPKEPASALSLQMAINDPSTSPELKKKYQAALDAEQHRSLERAEAGATTREDVARRKEDRKAEVQLSTMETALNQMESVLPQLEAEGFLPRSVSGGLLAKVRELARAKTHQLAYGKFSNAWQQWITNQGALIGLDRSVYNDLGRGGQMMYSAVKQFSETPPTADAARAAFTQWHAAIAAGRAARHGRTSEPASATKIRVRRKSDGKTGTLDSEREFDPTLYERLR